VVERVCVGERVVGGVDMRVAERFGVNACVFVRNAIFARWCGG
jgi:hypothetical protein